VAVVTDATVDDEELSRLVQRAGLSIAVAESLTGGQLSAALAAAPEAASWFRGGIVAYNAEVKYELLGVPRGPVVTECAASAMAAGACRVLRADVAVAVTGVGGPGPEEGQPPGTVWFALHHGPSRHTRLERFAGDPAAVLRQTRARATSLLADHLARMADAG
jgi:nicotinamide-nucleotide amidase